MNSILDSNSGIITSAQAQAAGVHRPAFSDYVRRHNLKRVARGIYVDEETFPDELALLQLRFPKAIFSHETALFLYDMTDSELLTPSVTVPSSYNAKTLSGGGAHVHYVRPEWHELGATQVKTPVGLTVTTYDKERTLCDLIRKRSATDSPIFRQAIKNYVRSKDKDLARLSTYAQTMGLESRVHEIMEMAL